MVAVGRPELDLESGEGIDRAIAAVKPSAIVNAAASNTAYACTVNTNQFQGVPLKVP